jgi:hypothetical protein
LLFLPHFYEKEKMNPLKKRFWLDFLALIALLLTVATGGINLILFLREKALVEPSFWGIPEETWLFAHVFFAITAVTMITIHILLHSDWIALAIKNLRKK